MEHPASPASRVRPARSASVLAITHRLALAAALCIFMGQSVSTAPQDSLPRVVSPGGRINSITIIGRVVAGVNGATGQPLPESAAQAFETRVLLPDHYLYTREDASAIRRNGFAGAVPLFSVNYKGGSSGTSYIDPERYVPWQRAAAARLLLGMFGILDGPLALQAKRTDTGWQVTGPEGFSCEVDVDPSSGVPKTVRYRDTATFYGPPNPRGASRRREEAEISLTFSDRTEVDGVLVPHSVVTTAKSLVTGEVLRTEDVRVSSVRINPPLAAADFEE